MAISLSRFLIPAALLVLFTRGALAATVTYNWNISWVPAAPFKEAPYYRDAIGINGQWPIPPLFVTLGDTLIINVYNGLGNETTSIHYHGIFQNGTTDMDGAAQVSQCPIQPGGSFTYNFTVNQPGTYWFHSHVRAQYPEGLRAPLIVHDPDSPYLDMYDEEIVFSLSDWYVTQAQTLMKSFVNYKNPTGAEPVPDAALMNDTQNLQINVEAGKTYFFRIANVAAFAGMYVWIEGHTMEVIEVDGVYTEPLEVEMFYITPAQRYGVLVTMHNDTSANFPIVASMDTFLFDVIPPTLNWNVTGWLVYDSSNPLPPAQNISIFNPFDDITLVPYDKTPLFENPAQTVTVNFVMGNLGDGANYAFINDVSYVEPNVPSLYTVLSTGANATAPQVYGTYTNTFVLNHLDIIEIVLNNQDTNKHPFHLHGHNFQAISRSGWNAGAYDPNNVTENTFPQYPMRRDTFMVHPGGNYVLRFRADNPGVWLYHCHIEWHTSTGLISTMVEAPPQLQSSLTVPADHYKVCEAQGIPTAGNAAGNTVDLFDLKGEAAPPPPLPAGFTARGIVALVFSCVSAFVGMAVIVWYGMLPIANQGVKGGILVESNGRASSNESAEEVRGAGEEVSEVPRTD